jgi:transglutaminase-like putative cysteine protease
MVLPADELTFVLDHPADQPVLARVLEADITPIREERDGRVRTTWTRTGVPGVQLDETLPPEERRYPSVLVSTAAGWPQVVQGYLAAVRPMLTSKSLGPVARELKPASAAARDVAAAALDWMHHRLRYTGLDFANSGVIPHRPEETLQRGYGDCKDLAAFLVALLEASGVPARMVLVHTADWHDDADELAGLNRFDHAIVMIPGSTPLWVDPTLRGLPPGTLSDLSMARMALVIDPATSGLTRTPVVPAAGNHAKVQTEITLPSYGSGAVKTVRTSTGTALAWPRFRAQMRSAEQLNKQVAEEVTTTHDTKAFTYRHSDPLSVTPFEEVLEITGSKKAEASDLDAVAALGFDAILEAIPDAVEGVPGDGAESEQLSGPIFVGAPRTVELVTRVRVSPLFELRGGPVSREGEVGQVRWTYRVEPQPDGAEARMQVTFGARVIPADEVQRVRQSMENLLQSDNRLEFANRPMRLMEDGKLLEAVRELRAMEVKTPRDPLLRALLARAAERAGLIAEAQSLAREARDLGPMQPPVARTVGWILSLNQDGVPYGKGMAREEALAALGTAYRLDPDGLQARKIEIELMARNAEGVLAGPGSDVSAALEALGTRGAKTSDEVMGAFHALLLWESGRDAELLEAKGLPATEQTRILQLAARARLHGGDAALTWLDAQAQGQKEGLIAGASFMLFKARNHPVAYRLAREVRDPRFAGLTSLMAKAVLRDARPFDPADPLDLVLEGYAHAVDLPTRVDRKALGLQDGWLKAVRQNLAGPFRSIPGAEQAVLDSLRGSMATELVELPGVGVLLTLTSHLGTDQHLLQRHGAGYRFHPHDDPAARQASAWEALTRGELPVVRSWLRYDLARIERASPGAVPGELRRLAQGNAAELALALSLIEVPEKGPALKAALQALETAWKARDAKSATGRQLGRAYVVALIQAKRHDEALAANATALAEGFYDQAREGQVMRGLILQDAERADLLEQEGKALLESSETREAGFAMLRFAARLRLDAAAYRDVNLQMAAADIERLGSLNNAAWSALFLGKVEEADLRRAEQALGPKGDRKSSLDTLAVLLAEHGEVDRAVVALAQLRGADTAPESAPSVLYARGRIAETLGFVRAAKAIYARIPSRKEQAFNDLEPLARKRLKALATPAGVPAGTPR